MIRADVVNARACALIISRLPQWSLETLNSLMDACTENPPPNDGPHNQLMAELRAEILTKQLFTGQAIDDGTDKLLAAFADDFNAALAPRKSGISGIRNGEMVQGRARRVVGESQRHAGGQSRRQGGI